MTSRLTIEYLPPASIRPDPTNPRQHKAPQIAAIARSIRTFGFNMPVLVDDDGMIIAGHGRVLAALKLGLAEIPVIRAGHLTEYQRRAYQIADNRLTDSSRWDDQLLRKVLQDLSVADLDFELDTIGFSVAEIDMRINPPEAELSDDPGDFEEGPRVTVLGDLWCVGRHRQICEDALAPATYDRLMAGKKADMCFADFPYNIPVQGFVSGLGKHQHREFARGSGEMDRDEFTGFLGGANRLIAMHCAPCAIIYGCMDWRHTGEMIAAGEGAFSELKNICVWVKPSGGMGSMYRGQHELVFVWKKRSRSPSQQRPAGQIWPESLERLELSLDSGFPPQRGRRPSRDSSDL